MELFANDLSLHEQFQDVREFETALSQFMRLRNLARTFGQEVYCHRNLLESCPVHGSQLWQVVSKLSDKNKQQALKQWLTNHGPFWDEPPRHSPGDYFEVDDDEIVTESAAAEAAYRSWMGIKSSLVSFRSSKWNTSPILVNWRRSLEGHEDPEIPLPNWFEKESFEAWLESNVPPPSSWNELRAIAPARFPRLTFSDSCFAAMEHKPVNLPSIKLCIVRLKTLDRLAKAFNDAGKLTAEGHEIYQQHFTGDKGWYSDSSDTEKNKFKKKMTFSHPKSPGEKLFCSWHGKIPAESNPLRIHFSWPIVANKPVYIVYVGPKLTKK